MKLQVKPYHHNIYPLGGLLIKGSNPVVWLPQLQLLNVNLQEVPVYVLPGTTPNSVWGCFVVLPAEQWKDKSLNAVEPYQLIHHQLFIPHYSCLYPIISEEEAAKLFPANQHLLHPEIGLVSLETTVDWSKMIALHIEPCPNVIAPVSPIFIPSKIQRAEIIALPPEDVLKELDQKIFPQKQFDDKPLTLLEKIKLGILRTLFKSAGNSDGGNKKPSKILEKFSGMFPGKNKWLDKLQDDLDELEKRNQTEMQKLMDLFKKNPEEALKYAIPLDDGTGRGGSMGKFEMSKRWNNFDLFSRNYSVGGSSVNIGDSFSKLQQQYRETASNLIKDGKYEKAAFVYMKLLKDNHGAAQALEKGELYAEAASVYLKYLQNKTKAAECYEKGQMISDAIHLYKEMKQYEKVGDLYMQQQKHNDAFFHYKMVADEHIDYGRYVKAAVLMRKKMNNPEPAQELLLQGWRKEKDAFNCINNYFQNIEDPATLLSAIENIYAKETNQHNKPVFLNALRHELKKSDMITDRVREMAYEIVAELASANPDLVSELRHFNSDKLLVKDVLRFKLNQKSS